jgi:hypothetical protein
MYMPHRPPLHRTHFPLAPQDDFIAYLRHQYAVIDDHLRQRDAAVAAAAAAAGGGLPSWEIERAADDGGAGVAGARDDNGAAAPPTGAQPGAPADRHDASLTVDAPPAGGAGGSAGGAGGDGAGGPDRDGRDLDAELADLLAWAYPGYAPPQPVQVRYMPAPDVGASAAARAGDAEPRAATADAAAGRPAPPAPRPAAFTADTGIRTGLLTRERPRAVPRHRAALAWQSGVAGVAAAAAAGAGTGGGGGAGAGAAVADDAPRILTDFVVSTGQSKRRHDKKKWKKDSDPSASAPAAAGAPAVARAPPAPRAPRPPPAARKPPVPPRPAPAPAPATVRVSMPPPTSAPAPAPAPAPVPEPIPAAASTVPPRVPGPPAAPAPAAAVAPPSPPPMPPVSIDDTPQAPPGVGPTFESESSAPPDALAASPDVPRPAPAGAGAPAPPADEPPAADPPELPMMSPARREPPPMLAAAGTSLADGEFRSPIGPPVTAPLSPPAHPGSAHGAPAEPTGAAGDASGGVGWDVTTDGGAAADDATRGDANGAADAGTSSSAGDAGAADARVDDDGDGYADGGGGDDGGSVDNEDDDGLDDEAEDDDGDTDASYEDGGGGSSDGAGRAGGVAPDVAPAAAAAAGAPARPPSSPPAPPPAAAPDIDYSDMFPEFRSIFTGCMPSSLLGAVAGGNWAAQARVAARGREAATTPEVAAAHLSAVLEDWRVFRDAVPGGSAAAAAAAERLRAAAPAVKPDGGPAGPGGDPFDAGDVDDAGGGGADGYADAPPLPAYRDPSPGAPPPRLIRVVHDRREVSAIVGRALAGSADWAELPPEVGTAPLWHVMWSWSKPPVTRNLLLVWQRVNHFRNAAELTRKDLLKKNLSRYTVLGGRMAAAFSIQPPTFVLPSQYLQFAEAFGRAAMPSADKPQAADNMTRLLAQLDAAGRGPGGAGAGAGAAPRPADPNVWIMKPVGLSRGRGIRVINDIGQVRYSEDMVIQRYIHNPLTLGGHKFDLRIYVLVTSFSPLEAFIYKRGFARLTSRPFNLNPDGLTDRFVHLTNAAVQREAVAAGGGGGGGGGGGVAGDGGTLPCLRGAAPDEAGGTKCSLAYLWRRLAAEGVDTTAVWEGVRDVVVKSLVCADDVIPAQPNSFELFGYDVLIDDTLRPWLIEVNSSPSMETDSPLDVATKAALIADTLAVVDAPPFDHDALLAVLRRRAAAAESHARRGLNAASAAAGFGSGGGAAARMSPADRRQLNADLAAILRGRRPRRLGEVPATLGDYERLAPGSDAFMRAMKLKLAHLRGRGGP